MPYIDPPTVPAASRQAGLFTDPLRILEVDLARDGEHPGILESVQ